MIAAATIASTTASGWAFSQQMLGTGDGNYNFNYTDPNHPPSTSQNTTPSESNGPKFYFGVQQGPTGPFSGFQSGNRFFGNSSNAVPPDPWRPLGNGD